MKRVAGLVVMAGLLLGCSDATTPKDRWITASVKLCDQRAEKVEVASAQLTPQSTAEQFTTFFQRFFEPAYRAQLDGQRAAGPPDDVARALVDDTTKVLDAMKADPASYAVAADPFADVDARWDVYGLTACGSRAARTTGSTSS